jgi:hypothetical protein
MMRGRDSTRWQVSWLLCRSADDVSGTGVGEKSSISGGSFCCKWLTQLCGRPWILTRFQLLLFLVITFLTGATQLIPLVLLYRCVSVFWFASILVTAGQHGRNLRKFAFCSESCVTRNWSIGACQLSFRNSADFHAMKTLEYGRLLPL